MLNWLKYGLVALVGCGFIGMIGYALWMREEIQQAQLEPQLITAPETPIKRRPEEPGGMIIPNRDKLVFDLLDSSGTVDVSGDLAPAPVDDAANDAMVSVSEVATVSRTSVGRATPQTASPVADQLALANIAATAASAPTPDVQEERVAPPTPVVSVKAAVPAADVVRPVTSATPAKATGRWGVQVGAVNSQADADRMIANLQSRFPALRALTPHTGAVSVGGGTRYRVQFTGAADKAAAARVCSQLGGKQACFPVGG